MCHMLWSFSVFSGRRAETCLILLFKEKRRTAEGKRNPETEEINVTCDGIEPNLNSAPGHARRGSYPVLGDGMRLGTCCGASETYCETDQLQFICSIPLGSISIFCFRPCLEGGKKWLRISAMFVSNLTNSIFKFV